MMTLSNVFTKTLDAYQSGEYTIISNMGGTRSGKTYSVMQLLYYILIGKSENLMISVVSRTLPHLKRGCIRDFENILDSVQRVGLVDVNKSDYIYTFTNNNRIEFFSADDTGKLHGAARNILFVNEANYIGDEKIKQLFVRTTGMKFIDYNPSGPFWIDNYRDRKDFIEFHSTYLDNDFLSEEQRKEIESNRKNKRWWAIYGEGKEYVREGLCFPKVIFDNEHQWEHPIYAMDFGFHDPTTCVKLEILGDNLYVEQMFYEKGMDVTDIKNKLMKFIKKGRDVIICDNAEPQIIHELKNSGYLVKPCLKGKNSVFDGIQLCNMYDIHYIGGKKTPMGKEFCSYSYEQDMDGNYTDIPEDKNNHCMDAMRYGVSYLRAKPNGSYTFSFV